MVARACEQGPVAPRLADLLVDLIQGVMRHHDAILHARRDQGCVEHAHRERRAPLVLGRQDDARHCIRGRPLAPRLPSSRTPVGARMLCPTLTRPPLRGSRVQHRLEGAVGALGSRGGDVAKVRVACHPRVDKLDAVHEPRRLNVRDRLCPAWDLSVHVDDARRICVNALAKMLEMELVRLRRWAHAEDSEGLDEDRHPLVALDFSSWRASTFILMCHRQSSAAERCRVRP